MCSVWGQEAQLCINGDQRFVEGKLVTLTAVQKSTVQSRRIVCYGSRIPEPLIKELTVNPGTRFGSAARTVNVVLEMHHRVISIHSLKHERNYLPTWHCVSITHFLMNACEWWSPILNGNVSHPCIQLCIVTIEDVDKWWDSRWILNENQNGAGNRTASGRLHRNNSWKKLIHGSMIGEMTGRYVFSSSMTPKTAPLRCLNM